MTEAEQEEKRRSILTALVHYERERRKVARLRKDIREALVVLNAEVTPLSERRDHAVRTLRDALEDTDDRKRRRP